MKYTCLFLALFPICLSGYAQNAVGINTDSPAASSILHVVSTDKGVLLPRMSATEKNAIASPDTGLLIFQNTGTQGFYYYDGNSWEIVGEDGDWTLTPSYLYTDGDVFVGIGTTTPDEELHIYSDDAPEIKIQRQSATDEAAIRFYRSTGTGTLDASIYVNSNEELVLQNHEENKDILFIVNDGGVESQIMYFDASNKKVGFNLTSVPQELIHADGVIRANSGFKGNDGSAASPTYRFYNDNNNGMYLVGTDHLGFSVGGSLSLQIESDGDVAPGADNATSLGTSVLRWSEVYSTNGTINTSDSTLKTNIELLQYGLAEVLSFRPVSYNWKEGGDENKIGLLAQEVREVVPEVVYGETEGELGINYAEMVPVLIKAIQELNAEVAELSAKIEELDGETAEATSQLSAP